MMMIVMMMMMKLIVMVAGKYSYHKVSVVWNDEYFDEARGPYKLLFQISDAILSSIECFFHFEYDS